MGFTIAEMINRINLNNSFNYIKLNKSNENKFCICNGKFTQKDTVSFGNLINITSNKPSVCEEIIYGWLNTLEPSKNIIKRKIENIIMPLGAKKYAQFLNSGGELVSFAVKENNNIVSGVIGGVIDNNSENRKLELCFLFLDKKYQRTKTGRKILINLFKDIKDYSEKNNIDALTWSTDISNKKAANLYNKITNPEISNGGKLKYGISLSEINKLSENKHFRL